MEDTFLFLFLPPFVFAMEFSLLHHFLASFLLLVIYLDFSASFINPSLQLVPFFTLLISNLLLRHCDSVFFLSFYSSLLPLHLDHHKKKTGRRPLTSGCKLLLSTILSHTYCNVVPISYLYFCLTGLVADLFDEILNDIIKSESGNRRIFDPLMQLNDRDSFFHRHSASDL